MSIVSIAHKQLNMSGSFRERINRREFSDLDTASDYELEEIAPPFRERDSDIYRYNQRREDGGHFHDDNDSILDFEEHSSVKRKTRCARCLASFRDVLTFLLSHVGLVSLVISYCLLGAVTFENLEKHYEIAVKQNVSKVRGEVSKDLWEMTEQSTMIVPNEWILNATIRLQAFEFEIIRMMKKEGWDGIEGLDTRQWTFTGALFYSIVVITTIGYGHITPKTHAGKIVTMFYAILGIPMMLACLTHIGDFLATAFRVLYWKVCCYVCTRRPRIILSPQMARVRSIRTPSRSTRMQNPKRSSLGRSRSLRISRRSQESEISDNYAMSKRNLREFRRTYSDEQVLRNLEMPKQNAAEKRISPSRLQPPQPSSTVGEPSLTSQNNKEQRREEQKFGSSLNKANLHNNFSDKTLGIYINKYAVDVTPSHSHRSKYKFQRHFQPSQSFYRHEMDDYYDFDQEEYWNEEQSEEVRNRPVPIWLCILLVVSYIIGGAFLFSNWEDWKFLDSAYFCFVTLTTIGFGDYVPAQKVKRDVEVSIALCSVYLLFGISLLAMSFNLVQEQVISSIRSVAIKLGIVKEELNH